MATVVLAGTLDTKGEEVAFVRDRVRALGPEVVVVDVGILGPPLATPDVDRETVARAAGTTVAALVAEGDRGRAIDAMARGLTAVARDLRAAGRLDAMAGLGGGGGTQLIATAMRELPVGVPKLLVSTMASGDTRPYVGTSDLTLMHAVVDVAGLNSLSRRILGNAAAAVAGMATAAAGSVDTPSAKPVVGATMFGVTTPCVTVARERLEALGYEVLVFHATGVGGRTLEGLVRDGTVRAVLDATTTELADELVGGVLSAGPDRLEAAGAAGIPQVVSLGALDMVNFGPAETVPDRFRDRRFHRHNAAVTLMRTTPAECAALGAQLAAKLSAARGPVTLFVPLRGVSAIAAAGGAFHDPAADAALLGAIRRDLGPNVTLREVDAEINDPAFATAMADELDRLVREAGPSPMG